MGSIHPIRPQRDDLAPIRAALESARGDVPAASESRVEVTSWQEIRVPCACGRRYRIVVENGRVSVETDGEGA